MVDDLRATLVQMLSGRMGGDASSHLPGDASSRLQEALLARINQRPAGDPLRDVLSQMLAQRQPTAGNLRADPQALLRAARDALNALQERDSAIAAALGACAECWGAEAGCPQCNGLGRPGWAAPDPVAFATWVAPAMRAMAQSASNAPADQPADQEANGPG